MHYLDNAATTRVLPQVVDTITETLQTYYANPSSLYAQGMASQQAIQRARKTIANALACPPETVVFTGSGTEGCNIAILGAARARKEWGSHLVATGYEHPAVAKTLQMLAVREGFSLTLVKPGPDGVVSNEAILRGMREDTVLVCAMQVNNETGAVIDVVKLAEEVKQMNRRTAVHVDGVQGFTKMPVHLGNTAIDTFAVSGHKLHAPKGVGALYVRKGFHFLPPYMGGGQENGMRPGTENIAYIAGFAKAVQLAKETRPQNEQTTEALHAQLLAGLAYIPEAVLNSPPSAYKGIVNFSLPGVKSEVMLHFLEERGVLVSSGSACSKGAPSHTLEAMDVSDERLDSALRVSFDGQNTPGDIAALLAGLQEGLQSLSRAKPR